MHPLTRYLDELKLSVDDMARITGIPVQRLQSAISGALTLTMGEARRIVLASGESLSVQDILQADDAGQADAGQADIVDLFQSQKDQIGSDVDTARLYASLVDVFAEAPVGSDRGSITGLLKAAAEATANTFSALSATMSYPFRDLLPLALQPVLSEMLTELLDEPPSEAEIHAVSARVLQYYFRS